MKQYLSMGFGVNSVALYLLMESLGMEFEALFVDHGGDWPDTYQYAEYFIGTGRPVTILKPDVGTIEGKRFDNLVDWFAHRRIVPSRKSRLCTDRFKVRTLLNYQQRPCIVHIGFASDEAHRAKIYSDKGIEHRWLLIEHDIDRQGCIDLIKANGLRVPKKSGCYICPFQGLAKFKELRRIHPDLFCRAQTMEEIQNNRITAQGRNWKSYYLCGVPLSRIDKIQFLPGFGEEYPPCQCGL